MRDRPSKILEETRFSRISTDELRDPDEAARHRKYFCTLWRLGVPTTYAIDEDGVMWVYNDAEIDLYRHVFKTLPEDRLLLVF